MISCEQQTVQDEAQAATQENTTPRITLGSLYTMNGDDYELSVEQDYGSYTQVFSLIRRDADGLIEYKETIKSKVRLRDLVEQETLNAVNEFSGGILTGGSIHLVMTTGTNEYLEICREDGCDTFEVVE
jgi:hypothetical protein